MNRRLISVAAVAAAVLATAAAVSSARPASAAAVKPRPGNSQTAAAQLHTTKVARLRAGRGARNRSLAVLSRNTDFYAESWGVGSDGVWWAYGVVASGPENGRRGWVAGDHVATGYRH
jgi:hypothetical protein